jgi:KDO2-lipid IV(A) lauroyltransferase
MRRNPDGTHHLLALPPIDPPPDHKPDTILRYTALYTRIIEDQIRAHPTQWLWWHKRWRAKPPPPEPAAP